jgi:glycosyltransferase involved in cell wall biosynthesis
MTRPTPLMVGVVFCRSSWSRAARLSAVPDVVMTNSLAGRKAHEALGYQPRRWELIPNGFDINEFAPSPEACRKKRRSSSKLPSSLTSTPKASRRR